MTSFLLLTFLLSTGDTTLDEPWFMHPVATARKLKGDELLQIGEIHDVQNHFPEALMYYEQAVDSYRTNKQRQGQATVLTKIGSIYERQGRRDAAAERLREALTLFSKVPDSPAHGDALLTLGRVSAWLGSREQARRLFQQAMERYGRSYNVQGLNSARIQLGLLQISDGQAQEGFQLLQQAFDNAQTRHDDVQVSSALLALGDGQWILDEPEQARSYYEQLLPMVEERPQAALEAGLRYRLSAVHRATGQYEKGIELSRRAVTLYQSLRDLSGEAASWSLLATLQQGIGQDSQAEESKQRALAIYRQQQLTVHAVRSSAAH